VTVSADFRQAVTPTKGMEDAAALSVGSPLRDTRAKTTFRFGRNMRQSRQIGRFLQGFHEAAFGEIAPFDVNPELTDAKPRLVLASPADQPRRIAQLLKCGPPLGGHEIGRCSADKRARGVAAPSARSIGNLGDNAGATLRCSGTE